MRVLIWIIVLFALAIGMTILLQNSSGEVYFILGDAMYHLSITTLVIGILLLWLIIYLVLKLLRIVFGIPTSFGRFSKKRHQRQADEDLNDAGMAFFEGRFQKAQEYTKKILKNKYSGHKKALALVIAAKSADEINEVEQRDQYLEKLSHLGGKEQLPRYLILAESAIADHDTNNAIQYIASAKKINPNLTQIIKLELRLAMNQKNSTEIIKQTDRLVKNGVLSQDESNDYYLSAYRIGLDQIDDAKIFKKYLRSVKKEAKEGILLVDIARKYQSLGLYDDVLALIKRYYPVSKNIELLTVLSDCFPYLSESTQRKTIEQAESWLKTSPSDDQLLLALGKLAYLEKLWGKAQSYLEASLSIKPSIVANLTLAKVLLDSDKVEEAEKYQEAAIKLLDSSNTDE